LILDQPDQSAQPDQPDPSDQPNQPAQPDKNCGFMHYKKVTPTKAKHKKQTRTICV